MTRLIWHELFFDVAPPRLYQALTEPAQLAQWWTTQVGGVSALGQTLEFGFAGLTQEMLVIGLSPHRLVRWRATDNGLEDWAGTTLEFAIFRQHGQTYLHLRHAGWREEASMYAQCHTDWAFYLLSLREFVEKGQGRPFPYDILNNGL